MQIDTANVMSEQKALEERAQMKGKLESQVRQVIKRFTKFDAKTMMQEQNERKKKAL